MKSTIFSNIKIHTHKNSRLISLFQLMTVFIKGQFTNSKSKNWWLSKLPTLGWEECKLSMKFFNGQYLESFQCKFI